MAVIISIIFMYVVVGVMMYRYVAPHRVGIVFGLFVCVILICTIYEDHQRTVLLEHSCRNGE